MLQGNFKKLKILINLMLEKFKFYSHGERVKALEEISVIYCI